MNDIDTHTSIDVVIPAYNGAAFIAATLDSVVQQNLAPQKIIIVDDGSTDDTHEIVSAYAKTSPVPIVVIKKDNGGLSSARNAGITASTSPLIAFVDADDLWEQDKLQKQLDIFTKTTLPNLGLVYCNYDLIDAAGNKDSKSYKVPLDRSVRGKAFAKLLNGNKILSSGSGVLIRKEVFETVGLFDESLCYGEDWDMWLRIAEAYDVDYTSDVLVHIRRHGQSMTADSTRVFAGEIAFYKKWLPILKMHGYAVPLKWRLKMLYRIIMRLPKTDLVKDALPILFVPFR